MDIKYNSYNVPKVDIGEITLGTKTLVGSAAELRAVAKVIDNSGIMIVSAQAGDAVLHGSVNANYYHGGNDEGIDFGGVTNYGGSPYIIAGSASIEDGKAYVTMTMTAVSTNRTSTKSK